VTLTGPVEVDKDLVARVTGEVGSALARRESEFGGGESGDLARQAAGLVLARSAIDSLDRERLTQGLDPLGERYEEELERRVLARLFGLGELERLLEDDTVENVVVNGPGRVIVRRAGGAPEFVDWPVDSTDELNGVVAELAATQGRSEHRFDVGHPELSMRLQDGSRLTAVRELSGATVLALRRHRHTDIDLNGLYQLGTVSALLFSLLWAAVRARFNILVVGGTDAGKTTLLRALIHCIDPWERLITIEDALELHLGMHPERHHDVVELEAREANIEGQGEFTMRQLTKLALRLSPDRVIVGEVRGPEILDMFQAMSQGNDGSLGTLHARSSLDAFVQCLRYGLRAPEQLTPEAIAVDIASSLDLVVHVRKLRDGRRVVSSVREVTGFHGAQIRSQEILGPDALGRATPTGTSLEGEILERLLDAGFDHTLQNVPGGGWSW
jgi:pilus assembly protein CpaF